jgi:hypothetical protein
MRNIVYLNPQREAHWLPMVRWMEAIYGPPGVHWDMLRNTEDGLTPYIFKDPKGAAHFNYVWNREPFMLPFSVWSLFTLELPQRMKIHGHWSGLGWTPQTVLLDAKLNAKTSNIIGGRYHYRPSFKAWFYEYECDALIDWMARYD